MRRRSAERQAARRGPCGRLRGQGVPRGRCVQPATCAALVGVIRGIDPSLEEAARSLGASRRRAFFRVTLPMSLPGILSGSLLVFALSISSYIVPALMGGFRVGVLPIHIFQQVAEGARFQFGATIAVILFLLSAGAVAIYLRVGARASGGRA
ncbi:ABC transporter permease subunit [Rhodovulum sp. 12E13]|nr:ABC transporter permease subunit [Rhodovulum sp. 12E13]